MTKRTIIIAEAGVNHNGKISIAKKLILAAKKQELIMLNFSFMIQMKWLLKKL